MYIGANSKIDIKDSPIGSLIDGSIDDSDDRIDELEDRLDKINEDINNAEIRLDDMEDGV